MSREAQPAQTLPFGVGGGLVAIKTLLSRDPCVHANTAIQMIDAMLAEQPAPVHQEPVGTVNVETVDNHRTYTFTALKKIPDGILDVYTSPQPAQQEQQEPVAGVVLRDGQPTLLQDKHIKETDERLFRAAPQPPAQPKLLGYAGITIWGGDATVTKVFTETEMKFAREPRSLIESVVGQLLDELAGHNIKGQS